MAADYYKVLGIDRKAGEKEVRTAFRKLARKFHPDVNHGQADASERFKEINEAHEVLSNPESRRLYDRYGENWRDAQRGGGQFQSGRRWQTQTIDPEAYQEFFGGRSGGFFDSFFRESRGGRRQGPQQPSVLEQPVEITLEEAFHGTTRALQVTGQSACANCDGLGITNNMTCQLCLGQGYSYQPVRGEVSIPAGVDTGSRVRVSPGGQQVVLVVTVQPHARFERKGDDLSTEVSVPLYDAVLGAEVGGADSHRTGGAEVAPGVAERAGLPVGAPGHAQARLALRAGQPLCDDKGGAADGPLRRRARPVLAAQGTSQ